MRFSGAVEPKDRVSEEFFWGQWRVGDGYEGMDRGSGGDLVGLIRCGSS